MTLVSLSDTINNKYKEIMLNNKQLEFIMLVGIPGAGKSTYIKQLDLTNFTIISSDDIIEEEAARLGKTYSEIFKDFVDTAAEMVARKFDLAVYNNDNIIWDQTNLTSKKRKSILVKVPKKYYKKAVLFTINLDVAKERVIKREKETGKKIPFKVLDDMHSRLEVPTQLEGFDEIELLPEVTKC